MANLSTTLRQTLVQDYAKPEYNSTANPNRFRWELDMHRITTGYKQDMHRFINISEGLLVKSMVNLVKNWLKIHLKFKVSGKP